MTHAMGRRTPLGEAYANALQQPLHHIFFRARWSALPGPRTRAHGKG
ncbi:hypothetical protein SAMN05192549_10513 [Duganella sacchari]|uniref:Uncharacterized protein n=1 Tax=Duganella sacchari TaxID=551987 RepID=A0A1M7PG00_9BURK|nr:hypothetical protein SAMN05192549_10513 [Duganella sacchari]